MKGHDVRKRTTIKKKKNVHNPTYDTVYCNSSGIFVTVRFCNVCKLFINRFLFLLALEDLK